MAEKCNKYVFLQIQKRHLTGEGIVVVVYSSIIIHIQLTGFGIYIDAM